MVAEESSAMVAESLDGVMEWAYENAHTRFRSIIYYVVEQVSLDVLHEDMIGKILDSNISTYINSDDDAGKTYWNLHLTNSFMTLMAAFIHRRTLQSIFAERDATKMEEHMNSIIQNQAVNQATLQSRYHVLAERTSYTAPLHRRKRSTGNLTFVAQRSTLVLIVIMNVKDAIKHLWTPSKSAKSNKSCPSSKSDFHSYHRHNRKVHRSKDDGHKVQRPVNNIVWDAQKYHTQRLVDKPSEYDDCVANSIAKW